MHHSVQPSLAKFSLVQRFFPSEHPTISAQGCPFTDPQKSCSSNCPGLPGCMLLKLRALCISSPGISIGTNPSCQSRLPSSFAAHLQCLPYRTAGSQSEPKSRQRQAPLQGLATAFLNPLSKHLPVSAGMHRQMTVLRTQKWFFRQRLSAKGRRGKRVCSGITFS